MGFLIALASATALTPVAAWVALRLDVVDRPGELKVHTRPVPYLGGIAVFMALAGPVALDQPALLVPAAMATALGLADDITDLSPRSRIGFELVVGLAAALVVDARGPLGMVVTVLMVLVLLNALNLLDGLDGLAAGVAFFSALGFAVVLNGGMQASSLALAGALAGFLVWNRPPARIYLGDAGSYMVGTMLATLLAASFGSGEGAAVSAAALLFVAVPVADTAIAIVRRLRAGRPLLEGDRGHVYDQLVDAGWSAKAATAACIAAQALLVVAGSLLAQLAAPMAIAAVACIVVVVAALALWRFTSPASWAS